MSDIAGINIHDLLGLSEPLTKLVETASRGLGNLLAPLQTKRMAKAKAKEIAIISDSLGENLLFPVKYEGEKLSIDSSDVQQLIQRAQNRCLFQEIKKQQNIEAVLENAYDEVDALSAVSAEPVDDDWVNSFFDHVANVSNEDMQKIWGKLLAGEIEKPGSVSIRTLDTLRKLTSKEAMIFQKITPFVLCCDGDEEGSYTDYFIPIEFWYEEMKKKYKTTSQDLILLNEIGLLNSDLEISIALHIDSMKTASIDFCTGTIVCKNTTDQPIQLTHRATILTEAGKELYRAVNKGENVIPPKEYIEECVGLLKRHSIVIPPSAASPVEISATYI